MLDVTDTVQSWDSFIIIIVNLSVIFYVNQLVVFSRKCQKITKNVHDDVFKSLVVWRSKTPTYSIHKNKKAANLYTEEAETSKCFGIFTQKMTQTISQ